MTDIQKKLFELQDMGYAQFQMKLTPGIEEERFIGVRSPELKKLARELKGSDLAESFIKNLPHYYYDENMLHGCLLYYRKDYDECIERIEEFLPYVDNWAVCDTLKPKVLAKHKEELIEKIRIWAQSDKTYTCRFGIEMLMNHFLDADFKPEYNEIVAVIKSEEYYVNMMIAWYFATALAKQWDATFTYIENNKMDIWVHNKTIQKAVESYRITDEQKEILKSLRRKK